MVSATPSMPVASPAQSVIHKYAISLTSSQLNVEIDVTGEWPNETILLRKLGFDGEHENVALYRMARLGIPSDNRFRISMPDGTFLSVQQRREKKTSIVTAEFENQDYKAARMGGRPHHLTFALKQGKVVRMVESWAKGYDRYSANGDGVVERVSDKNGVRRETRLHGEYGQYRVVATLGTKWGFRAASEVWQINNTNPIQPNSVLPAWRATRTHCVSDYKIARGLINWTVLIARSGLSVPLLNGDATPQTKLVQVQGRKGIYKQNALQWSAHVPKRFDGVARQRIAELKV